MYKHKNTGIFWYKIETPERLYFIFENRAIDKPVLSLKFKTQGLKMEDPTDGDDKWVIKLSEAFERCVHYMTRTELTKDAKYKFSVKLKK